MASSAVGRAEVEECSSEPSVALRLVAAAAWQVVRERQVQNFPRVVALLDAVFDAAPDLVHFRHFAKLRLGLQAKVIMTMLKEEQSAEKIYEAIDSYFPETEPQPHPCATTQDLKLVQAAQGNFRELVLGLLSDCRCREKYVQEHLETDYGAAFLHVVEELFGDYLCQLESTLPNPVFHELLEAATIHGPRQSSPNPDVLSRYLTDMGYQIIETPVGQSSPIHSNPHCQSEEKRQLPTTEPCSQQSFQSRSRRRRNHSPPSQKENSQGNLSGLQPSGDPEMDALEDIVMDSSSECGNSPFKKGNYQCTQHNTLIPTFQEHLQNGHSP